MLAKYPKKAATFQPLKIQRNGSWVAGFCNGNSRYKLIINTKVMRNINYKNKTVRIADETWENLKGKRIKSGKTWNLFLLLLIDLYKKYGKKREDN